MIEICETKLRTFIEYHLMRVELNVKESEESKSRSKWCCEEIDLIDAYYCWNTKAEDHMSTWIDDWSDLSVQYELCDSSHWSPKDNTFEEHTMLLIWVKNNLFFYL